LRLNLSEMVQDRDICVLCICGQKLAGIQTSLLYHMEAKHIISENKLNINQWDDNSDPGWLSVKVVQNVAVYDDGKEGGVKEYGSNGCWEW